MNRLLYLTPTSLDGYISDDGNYEWSAPDEEVLGFINDLMRPVGLSLYGRRTYETMAVWATPEVDRLFEIAGADLHAENAARTRVRAAGHSRAPWRCLHRRPDSRGARDPRQDRRRTSPDRCAADPRRREADRRFARGTVYLRYCCLNSPTTTIS
jgi:hypothetical protein